METNDKGTYLFDYEKFNEIKTRMESKPMDNTDKLKEIRYNNRVVKHLDKLLEWKDINEGQYCVFHTDLIETIDKTLEYGKQLGREEVIGEIENWALWKGSNTPEEKVLLFFKALNQLKEQKK